MRRFPPYMIVAVCGILFLSAGMVIITADNDPSVPPVEPIALMTLTPTELVSVAGEQAVQPTDIPPSVPVEAPAQAVEAPPQVIAPTVEVVLVQPTTVVQPVQESVSVIVPTRDGVAAVPATPVSADGVVVLTPVLEQPNQPLGTLPPSVQVLPTVEIPMVQPTIDQSVIQPTVQPAMPVAANTQVMGQVNVPLRNDFAGVAIVLTLPDGQVVQTQTDAAGNFAFANLTPGTYRLDAGLEGYLSSQASFTLTDGQVLLMPTSTLIGGDTNLDNRIDLTDAALIAANFDGTTTVPNADLNHDGIVDIRDLTAIGAFFGQAGPTAWQQ